MAFKPQSNDEEAMSEINVTPLVDVMLVLMIIFLVTAPLLTQAVKVNLPKTVETAAEPQEPPLQVGVDSKGQMTLNHQVVKDQEELKQKLNAEASKNPEIALHLYADEAVNYGKVAEVMAIIQNAGISKLGVVTIKQ